MRASGPGQRERTLEHPGVQHPPGRRARGPGGGAPQPPGCPERHRPADGGRAPCRVRRAGEGPQGPHHRRHRGRVCLRRGHRPAAGTAPRRRAAGHQLHHLCADRQAAHAGDRRAGRLLPGRRRRTGLRCRLPDRHPGGADRQPGNRPGHPGRCRCQLAAEGTGGGAGGQGNPAGRTRAARPRRPSPSTWSPNSTRPPSSWTPPTGWPTASPGRTRWPSGSPSRCSTRRPRRTR